MGRVRNPEGVLLTLSFSAPHLARPNPGHPELPWPLQQQAGCPFVSPEEMTTCQGAMGSWELRLPSPSRQVPLSWPEALFAFLLPLPGCWASCHCPCAGFSSYLAFTVGAFTELGLCCAWPPPCKGHAKVVSARLNLSYGTIYIGGVCNFLGSVSSQQKFEARYQCHSPWMDQCYSFVLQLSFI